MNNDATSADGLSLYDEWAADLEHEHSRLDRLERSTEHMKNKVRSLKYRQKGVQARLEEVA